MLNYKSYLKRFIIYAIIAIAVSALAYNNYFMYSAPIAKITHAKTVVDDVKKGTDGKEIYEETYYTQTLTGVIKNGDLKGEKVQMKNSFAASQVYDLSYEEGDRVFIENVKADENNGYSAVVTGAKRDFFVIISLCIMMTLFLAIGGKEGFLTIFSLVGNLVFFYFVIVLYFKGVNILAMCIPMSLIFTAMLLFFMYGRNIKTYLALVATMLTVIITVLLTAFMMLINRQIDYDFMEFLIQPYDRTDADFIFLSQVLICSMGAIMDVVVTLIVTLDEIVSHKKIITKDQIRLSCRNVGDEVVGTMISIMFFTNLASGIPFFLLSMRNGIAITTILKYNSFFEIARFLTGSIGILLAIPVSAAVAYAFYRKAGKISCS